MQRWHSNILNTVPPHSDSSWSVADKGWNYISKFQKALFPPFFFFFFLQEVKVKVLEQVQDQLNDILEKALIENNPFIQRQLSKNGTTAQPSSRSGGAVYYHYCCLQWCSFLPLTPLKCLCPLRSHFRSQRMDNDKVFMARPSVLE